MNPFRRHVSGKLSAYAGGELPRQEADQIDQHLAACPACNAELQQIVFGIQLAKRIPIAPAPDSLWLSIREAHTSAPGVNSWRLASAIALPLLIAVAVAWYLGVRQRLYVTRAASEPSAFEAVAIKEHSRRLQGAVNWELETSDIARTRNWVQATSGLSANIPDARPPEDLKLVGAKLVSVGRAAAAEIAYEVHSRPVTLITARLSDLPDPPREGRMSKDVTYRIDSEFGYKILTWGSSGQAYVMVSNLPGFGQEGCFLCHTAEARRELIRKMNPQSTSAR